MHVRPALIAALALCLGLALMPVFCAEPQGIPEKWRYADQAIYLLSFPYPTYETVTRKVNETEIVEVVEKPAEVSDITIIMCVWNVSDENPVFVSVDRDEAKIVREGYYVLSFKPPPGLHSVAVYSKYKIYEVAAVKVKPPPPLPWMITWEEFLQKLKEAKEEVIRNLIIASAGGVALGIFLKRKSKIFTYWIPFALAWLCVPPYMNPMDYYPLFGLSIASIIAYWLCPPFARPLGVLLVSEGSVAETIEFRTIPRDPDDGQAILGISPRYVRHWFMLKKKIKMEDFQPIGFDLNGQLIETVVAKSVEETQDKIEINCSSALARALVDAQLVEKISEELSRVSSELHLLKRAWPLVVTLHLKEIEKVFGLELFKIKTWREATSEARKAAGELAERLTEEQPKPESKPEGGETGGQTGQI